MKVGDLEKGFQVKTLALERQKRVVFPASKKQPGEWTTTSEEESSGNTQLVPVPNRADYTCRFEGHGVKRAPSCSGGAKKKISKPLSENVVESPVAQDRKADTSTQTECHWTDMEELIKEMRKEREMQMDMLKELRENQAVILEEIQKLKRVGQGREKEPKKIYRSPITLPAGTMEDLEKVEELLHNDDEFNFHVVSLLGGVLTGNLGSFVRMNMRKLMTNTVAMDLNWFGHRSKRAFSQFKMIITVLKHAAEEVPNRYGEEMFKKEISNWLCQANRRRSNPDDL